MPQPVTLPDTIYASGKDAGQESFPVASWLLPPSKRADIMAFYRFARAADDIADHPSLPPDEKLRLLDQMEGRLPPAGAEHAAALLVAFRQDASKARYADWDELMQTLDDVGAPEVWVTHGREEALVHAARQRGIAARALSLIGFEEEGQ